MLWNARAKSAAMNGAGAADEMPSRSPARNGVLRLDAKLVLVAMEIVRPVRDAEGWDAMGGNA